MQTVNAHTEFHLESGDSNCKPVGELHSKRIIHVRHTKKRHHIIEVTLYVVAEVMGLILRPLWRAARNNFCVRLRRSLQARRNAP